MDSSDENVTPAPVPESPADTGAEHEAAPPPFEGPPGEILPPLEPKKKKGSFLKELPILILIAFGLALLIKSFLIQAFYIPSESMVPTLNVGDRVLVNKVIYHLRKPHRGEIIVFVGERFEQKHRSFWTRVRESITSGLGGATSAERDFIKRIIGLPGETIEVKDGKVTITPTNGKAPFTIDEPYLAQQPDLTPFGPYKVPEGSYFVMGDNRANSSDSRGSLGPIKGKEIVGRAFVRIWPITRFRFLTRPHYKTASAGVLILLPLALRARRRRHAA